MSPFILLPLALILGAAAGYCINRIALIYLFRYTGEKEEYRGFVGALFPRGSVRLAADMVIIEAAATFLSAAAVVRWNGTELIFILLILYLILLLSLIDSRIRILPNRLNLAGIVVGIGYAFFREGFTPADALTGMAVGGGFAVLSAVGYQVLRSREGLGFGDVKLLAFFGSFAGWEGVLLIIAAGSILGAAWGMASASREGSMLHVEIPFGPFLGLGAIGYLFGFM